MNERQRSLIKEAAEALIAAADDSGESLVDVIAETERYIVVETKVGGPVPEGRRGYELVNGRLRERK